MRTLKRIGMGCVVLVMVIAIYAYAAGHGWLGQHETAGEISKQARPEVVVAERTAVQREEAEGSARDKQILFGDFHVHTTFSLDAFLMSIPMASGTGSHPPADACDFARHCAALDFWSINDHAESITPRHWDETVDAIRQCNAVAGDPENPDLVSFLGWEWSQMGYTPETHYGHKNVVLRGLEDGEIPTRPIGARADFNGRFDFTPPGMTTAIALTNGKRGRDFARFISDLQGLGECPEGVPVRDLPPDCLELARRPEDLFQKLRDWGLPAIVIPHGTTWGIYTPPGSTWAKQIPENDPALQTMVEVYSGHGSAEEYRSWRAVDIDAEGGVSCPAPGDGYIPECWRAGELVLARCLGEVAKGEDAGPHDEGECRRRAAKARQNHAEAGIAGWRTLPATQAQEWLDAGQCRDCFLPAYGYRPGGSVQYMLAKRSFEEGEAPRGLRFAMIGSSDIHTARAGNGYKEFGRGEMTEGMGRRGGPDAVAYMRGKSEASVSESIPIDPMNTELTGLQLFENERSTSFFTTGGLVAVHSEGRSREAIWRALERKEVYATSGPRLLLWFELMEEGAPIASMGASVVRSSTPHFRVRAVGSFEQLPGCPDYVAEALGPDRLRDLCLDECYHPSPRRRLITRIEIVRIKPQTHATEPLDSLIEDPWRSFDCPADPAGCAIHFSDEEFALGERDTLYYARAIEAPSQAIHADALRCVEDESGRCIEVELCNVKTAAEEECLGELEERAWSSPIWLDYRSP